MALFVFVCDFGVKDQLLGVIVQRFSCVLEFNLLEPLDVDEFPDLCEELTGQFESCSFASYVSEIRLLCMCEGYRNETYNYIWTADTKDV